MKHYLTLLLFSLSITAGAQQKWSLQDCLQYAREHNIALRKSFIDQKNADEEIAAARAALFPSLSFSTQQTMTYRPFQDSPTAMVAGGMATATADKVTQNGNYGLNANWTVWNGGRNQQKLKQQKKNREIATYDTEKQMLNIEEQVLQYFVQIQYLSEGIGVCEQVLKTAESQYARGKEMFETGKMSKADLAQLESQVASAQYDVVNAKAQVDNVKRQLKTLLQLGLDNEFDIQQATISDENAESPVPDAQSVYVQALITRPEIKNAEAKIEVADIKIKGAKAGYLPTLSVSAGIGDSHYTGSQDTWGTQMKRNLNCNAGVSVSVPIFDNRTNRTTLNKARLDKITSELDLADKRIALSNIIEQYHTEAVTNQQKFLAAKVAEKSQQTSYELLDEQFRCGLKNAIDVLQGRDRILQASQDKLQSKYRTILNIALLHFYAGKEIKM